MLLITRPCAHQVEIEGGEGCEKLATYLSVQLGWPDKDRPQVGKTSTSKHGVPCAGVQFTIDRDLESRKGFASKLERRQLVGFELYCLHRLGRLKPCATDIFLQI